jgi:hypothetical protein
MNIDKLKKDIKESLDKLSTCEGAINFMESHSVETLLEARELRSSLTKQYNELSKQLSDIRNNCDHDWRYTGSGSHDDFYKCTKCGEFKTE